MTMNPKALLLAFSPFGALATVAPSQVTQPPPYQQPQGGGQQPQGVPAPNPSLPVMGFTPRDGGPTGFAGLRSIYPQAAQPNALMQGSPGYPGAAGLADAMKILTADKNRQLLPRAAEPPGAWPSWVKLPTDQSKLESGYTRAVLTRNAERVWILDPGEPVFVPLWYWDKHRIVTKGSQVDVRHESGEFVVTLHTGATLRSRGITKLTFLRLDEEQVELGLDELREIWWSDRQGGPAPRRLRIVLPDGTVAESVGTDLRASNDGEFGSLINFGPGVLTLKSPFGATQVAAGFRARFFTKSKLKETISGTLQSEGGLEVSSEGRVLGVKSHGDGGVLIWSGARITLPPGSELRLDPLAGNDFPLNKPAPNQPPAK
jgi:hypothetical protein